MSTGSRTVVANVKSTLEVPPVTIQSTVCRVTAAGHARDGTQLPITSRSSKRADQELDATAKVNGQWQRLFRASTRSREVQAGKDGRIHYAASMITDTYRQLTVS